MPFLSVHKSGEKKSDQTLSDHVTLKRSLCTFAICTSKPLVVAKKCKNPEYIPPRYVQTSTASDRLCLLYTCYCPAHDQGTTRNQQNKSWAYFFEGIFQHVEGVVRCACVVGGRSRCGTRWRKGIALLWRCPNCQPDQLCVFKHSWIWIRFRHLENMHWFILILGKCLRVYFNPLPF